MIAGRAVRAVVAVLVLAAAGSAGSAVGAQEGQANASDIKVVDQTQWVPDDGNFLLSVDVTEAPPGSRLTTSLHREVPDRPAFLRTLFGTDLGPTLPSPGPVELDEVVPTGGARRVTIVISLRKGGPTSPGRIFLSAGLGRAGVYPVQVRLVDRDGEPRATIVTHLVRLPVPERNGFPLTTSLLLDLHARPSIAPDGTVNLSEAAVADISSRVEAAAAHPDTPVTFVPTPETIEAMARAGGRPARVVRDLADISQDNQIIDGPYVDVALTSWFDAGMDEELNRQRERGNAILTKQLGPPDGSTWPANRELSTTAATKLWALGVRRLLLPAGGFGSVPPTADPRELERTPTRPFEVRTPLASPLQAMAIDDQLPVRFTFSDDPTLAAHHVLSELAVIQGEAPEQHRGVVLAPPKDWQASPALLATLLRDLANSPLLDPATIDGLFAAVPPADEEGPAEVRELTPLPAAPLGGYARAVADLRTRLTSYRGMVGSTSQVDAWFQRLLISGARQLTPGERDRYLAVIGAAVDTQLSGIDAPRRQTVTLTAREGRIPLIFRSGLDQRVTVTLELEASRRLEFPDGNRVPVTLDPGTEQVSIRVRARSPGDSPLEIRVVSPDGQLVVDSTRLTVRSTAVSGIGTVLSVGAAAFLMLWWVRHWRRGRRAGPDPGPADPIPQAYPSDRAGRSRNTTGG